MRYGKFPLVDVLGLLMRRIIIPNGPEYKAGIEGRERLLVFLTGAPIPVGGVPETVVECHREYIMRFYHQLCPTGALTLEVGRYVLMLQEDRSPEVQRLLALGWLSKTTVELRLGDEIELTSFA